MVKSTGKKAKDDHIQAPGLGLEDVNEDEIVTPQGIIDVDADMESSSNSGVATTQVLSTVVLGDDGDGTATKANKSTDLRAKQKAEILEFLGFYELVDPSTLDNAEATISAKRSQFIEQFEKSHPKKCKDFIAYYDSSAIHDEIISRQHNLKKPALLTEDIRSHIVSIYELEGKSVEDLDAFVADVSHPDHFDIHKLRFASLKRLGDLENPELRRRMTPEFLEKIVAPLRPNGKKRRDRRDRGEKGDKAAKAPKEKKIKTTIDMGDGNGNDDDDTEDEGESGVGSSRDDTGGYHEHADKGNDAPLAHNSSFYENNIFKGGRKKGNALSDTTEVKRVSETNKFTRIQLLHQCNRLSMLQDRIDGLAFNKVASTPSDDEGDGDDEEVLAVVQQRLDFLNDSITRQEETLLQTYDARRRTRAKLGIMLPTEKPMNFVVAGGMNLEDRKLFLVHCGNQDEAPEMLQDDVTFGMRVISRRNTLAASEKKQLKKGKHAPKMCRPLEIE